MIDQQAYAGNADLTAGSSEYNRLNFVIEQVLNRVATMTLVRVVAIGAPGLLDVQPVVSQLDGAGNSIPHGTIHNVPFLRLQGGPSAIIIDPVVGDIGLAVFAHSDISGVKATKDAAPPGSRRRFDWADAVYLGGVLNGEPTQYVELGTAGVRVRASAGQTINLSSSVGVDTDTEFRVDGVRVVTNRQPAVPSPTGGAVIDVQARAAIVLLLTALQTHGLLA